MGTIVQLIESRENEIRASTVLLPNGNTIKCPNNLLYPLETTAADVRLLCEDKDFCIYNV